MPADNFSSNDIDRIMQSRPRRQMQDERAAGVLEKFKLNPGVVSVQMDANHARGPATTAGDERPLIERSEPTVRHSHLIVQTERSWRRWRVLRRRETGGVAVNGRKLHDSSVCVAGVRPLRTYYRGWGSQCVGVRIGVGFYALATGEQAK